MALITPEGAILSAESYNRAFTLHGIIMVWFFLVPSIPVTLGNFILPLMIGARDLAFPRLNLLSWYLFIAGGLVTLYTPLSTHYAKGHVMLVLGETDYRTRPVVTPEAATTTQQR